LKTGARFFKKSDVIFIGFGNPYRSDDGFGIEAVKRLKESSFPDSITEFDGIDALILDLCADKKSGLIIFLDTSDFGGEPGELRVFSPEQVEDFDQSHKVPLKLYMNLLKNAGYRTYLIAVQPETLENIQEPRLSEKVDRAIKYLVSLAGVYFNQIGF